MDVMLVIRIEENRQIWQEQTEKIKNAKSFQALMGAAWQLASQVTIWVIEETLAERAEQATEWRLCECCGKRLESKGMLPRQVKTMFGIIHWKRRVGRCPDGCPIRQVVPFDEELGLGANQKTDESLKHKACLLAVFVPFETAAMLLEQLVGIVVSATSIWGWVQEAGMKLEAQLEDELQKLEQGIYPAKDEELSVYSKQPLLIGADGVMVPFRPDGG